MFFFFLWSEKQNKTALATLMKWGWWLEWRPAAEAVQGLRGWSGNTPEDCEPPGSHHIFSLLCIYTSLSNPQTGILKQYSKQKDNQ